MGSKMTFLAGAAVGYVLGSRAGRARYEEIKAKARSVLDDDRVQDVVETAKERAAEAAGAAGAAVRAKVGEVAGDAGTALKDKVTHALHRDDDGHTPPPTMTTPPVAPTSGP